MKRSVYGVATLLLATLVLTGARAAPAQAASQPTPVEQLYAELAKLPADERAKRIEEGARKEGKLVFVHTWRGKLARDHIALFRKRYPFINVDMTDIGSQDASERLVAEETAGRHLTDVVSLAVPDLAEILKADLLAKGEARRLLLGRRDAVAVSATDRDSTRPLLMMIAERLKDRWTHAATVPSYEPEAEEPREAEGDADEAASMTTLAEMMGERKRRRPTARA